MENNFVYVNHDNIKTQQHSNYWGIHLNNLGSKILTNDFIITLNTLN